MDKPSPFQPPAGDAPAPLNFNVNQAAALCGITAHQLAEWTDLGYVHAIGQGDRRTYNRDALRQIMAVRRALSSGRPPIVPPGAPTDKTARRPEEFSVPDTPLEDQHLALQTQMFFALNPVIPQTLDSLAQRMGVSNDQMVRVLDQMVAEGSLHRRMKGREIQYHVHSVQLQGPRLREQRIRATRRNRLASDDEG